MFKFLQDDRDKEELRKVPAVRKRCDIVAMFAVSDGEWLGIEDLLDSMKTYFDCSYEVVVQDDVSTDGTYERLLDRGIWVSRNPKKLGFYDNNVTLRRAFYHAVTLFDSPLYLKIDPDALVIGPGFVPALRSFFADNEKAGLVGNYLLTPDGNVRDMSYWQGQMELMRKPLGQPLQMAEKNNYRPGYGVMGGCYCLSQRCLEEICNRGWLDRYQLGLLSEERCVGEDILIVMLTYAAGFIAADFGGPGQPMAIRWQGLPMSPEELVAQNRLVTHSIKYAGESLAQRDFFRKRRLSYKEQQARV